MDNAFAELLRARKEHCFPIRQQRGPRARMPANGCIPRTLCGSDSREPASVVGGLADWQCARLFFRAWKMSLSSFDDSPVAQSALERGDGWRELPEATENRLQVQVG